jgi:hypothetical protein
MYSTAICSSSRRVRSSDARAAAACDEGFTLDLDRRLDEISFRWNCRIKHEYSKGGKRRRLITTIPLPDMMSRLLQPSIGRQIRRTENYGFMVLASPLARSA